MYLPDTNIFILAFHSREPEATFLKKHLVKKNIAISVVVIGELYGKANDEEKNAIGQLILELGCLPIDEKIARIAGEYRKQFLRKTKRVFLLDCFLAAQAKINDLTIVTNNKADFPMKDIKVISP